MEATNDSQMHTCFVCDKEITDVRKAASMSAGFSGLQLIAHTACLVALDDEISHREAEADAAEASFMAKAQEEVNNELLNYALSKGIVKEIN